MLPSPDRSPGFSSTTVIAPTDLSWRAADALAAEHGDSFYLFDPAILAAQVAQFREAFRAGDVILYPYKANSHPSVLDAMQGLGVGAETCSSRELHAAADRGLSGSMLHATGCGRSHSDLREVAASGATVIVDDASDVGMLAGHEVSVLIRCDFAVPGRSSSRLGVSSTDLAEAATLARRTPGIRLVGLHCHFPGIGVDMFAARMRLLIDAARRTFPDTPPRCLTIGGGFHGGVPHLADPPTPVDYAQALLPQLADEYGEESPTLVLEPGTALIAPAVRFVTRVRVVKQRPERPIAIVAGSLLDISPNTRRTNFPVHVIRQQPSTPAAEFDISGSTPMLDEYLAFGVPGPLSPGDFVCFDNVGAYSWSMAPEWLGARPPLLTRVDDGWRS